MSLGPGMGLGGALDPLDGFVHVLHFPQPEAGDEFVGGGEGAVGDGAVGAVESDALAFRCGLQAIAGFHYAGLEEFLIVPAHRFEEFGGGHDACFAVRGCLYEYHYAHGYASFAAE